MKKVFHKNLIYFSLAIILGIIINPIVNLDLALMSILFLVLGNYFLKEKMLLVFLIIRPILDKWYYYNIFSYEEYSINLNAALAIIFLLWGFYMIIKHKIFYKKNNIILPFLFFLLIASTSFLYSVSPITSIIESVKILNIFLFFYLTYFFIKKKIITKKELLTSILISAIFPILLGVYQLITGIGITTFSVKNRIYGSFVHPNIFAFFSLFLLFLHYYYAEIEKINFWKDKKYLKYFIYLFLLILIFFTYTRAALIGLLIFVLINSFFKNKKLFFSILLIFPLFYLVFYPLNNFQKKYTEYDLRENNSIARLTTRDEDADSISWRLSLIKENEPIIRNKAILGYGYGTFPKVWEENRSNEHKWDDSAEAHNDYLRILLETGIIGFIAYLILLLSLFHKSLQINKKEQKIFISSWVIVFIVLSLSDNMLHHTALMWLMWSCFALFFVYFSDEVNVNFLEE